MGSRLELHDELRELLGSDNVYFQPPENKKINYDCIIYHRSGYNVKNANDNKYLLCDRYELEYIYRDPDTTLTKDIIKHFMYCRHDRHFVSDNLNHETFDLYY